MKISKFKFLFIFIFLFIFMSSVDAVNVMIPTISSVEYIKDTSVKINFKHSESNKTCGYQIYNMTTGSVYNIKAESTSYTLSGLNKDVVYNVALRSVCGKEAGLYTNSIRIIPGSDPLFYNIVSGDKKVTLKYIVKDPKIKKIRISYNGITKDVSNLKNTTITGLENGKSYSFKIRGIYEDGKLTSWSKSLSKVPEESKPVINKLSSKKNSVNIEYSKTSNPKPDKIQIYVFNSTKGKLLRTVNITDITGSYNVTKLANLSKYTFRIRNCYYKDNNKDSYACGSWGAYKSINTLSGIVASIPVITDVVIKDATTVKISYNHNTNDKTCKYEISNITAGKSYTAGNSSSGYTLTGLKTGTQYEIAVRNVCSNGTSLWSKPIKVIPSENGANIYRIDNGDGKLKLNYIVKGNPYSIKIKNVTDNIIVENIYNKKTYTFNGLINGKLYKFKMKTCDKNGVCSEEWSKSFSGIPEYTRGTIDKLTSTSNSIKVLYGSETKSSGNGVVASVRSLNDINPSKFKIMIFNNKTKTVKQITTSNKSSYTFGKLYANTSYTIRMKNCYKQKDSKKYYCGIWGSKKTISTKKKVKKASKKNSSSSTSASKNNSGSVSSSSTNKVDKDISSGYVNYLVKKTESVQETCKTFKARISKGDKKFTCGNVVKDKYIQFKETKKLIRKYEYVKKNIYKCNFFGKWVLIDSSVVGYNPYENYDRSDKGKCGVRNFRKTITRYSVKNVRNEYAYTCTYTKRSCAYRRK